MLFINDNCKIGSGKKSFYLDTKPFCSYSYLLELEKNIEW